MADWVERTSKQDAARWGAEPFVWKALGKTPPQKRVRWWLKCGKHAFVIEERRGAYWAIADVALLPGGRYPDHIVGKSLGLLGSLRDAKRLCRRLAIASGAVNG